MPPLPPQNSPVTPAQDQNQIVNPTPDTFLTGSQLEEENRIRRRQRFRRLSIVGACLIVVAIVIGVFISNRPKKPQSESITPSPTATSQTSNPVVAPTTMAVKPNPFKDVRYTNPKGTVYQTKFFTDAETQVVCAPNVSGSACSGLFGSDSSNPRSVMAFYDSKYVDINHYINGSCNTQAFVFTSSAGESASACQEAVGGRVLYYATFLTLGGRKHLIIFQGESKNGQAFPDVSAYQDDLRLIFPTIALGT